MNISVKAALLILTLLAQAALSSAEVIEQTLPTGKVAKADFRQGNKDKPAVIFIHGFLTTHNFNTIRSAVEMFAENGITVLAPTLTLGINRRDSGMPCSAIQTHSLADSLNEIEYWVNWLSNKHKQQVVLIGHSMGALQIIAFAENRPLDKVQRIVPLSAIYLDGHNPEETRAHNKYIAQANKMVKNNINMPSVFSLSYCRNSFTSPPAVFLSYASWNQQRILNALKKIKKPVNIIMGSNDRYFSKEWQTKLKNANPQTFIIEGASHFFDATHEFDLHDRLVELVNRP